MKNKPALPTFRKLLPKSKPSFAFIGFFIAAGYIAGGIVGALLGLVISYGFELVYPSTRTESRGVIQNRTKAAINVTVILILYFMINLNIAIREQTTFSQMNVFQQMGVDWDKSFSLKVERRFPGILAHARSVMNLLCLSISVWLIYQAYLARRLNAVRWMWTFLGFGVLFLPFLHFSLGALWVYVDWVLIGILGVSTFAFRIPQKLPELSGPFFNWSPASSVSPLERELTSLQKLHQSGILNAEEFEAQKQAILEKFKEG